MIHFPRDAVYVRYMKCKGNRQVNVKGVKQGVNGHGA